MCQGSEPSGHQALCARVTPPPLDDSESGHHLPVAVLAKHIFWLELYGPGWKVWVPFNAKPDWHIWQVALYHVLM